MTDTVSVSVFFNFRSPYCYLVSKRLFGVFEDFHVEMDWRPLGGWNGRSAPEQAKVMIPVARQDMQRWGKKMGIPVVPPPTETDPTIAGLGSLYAEQQGKLKDYVIEVMRAAWGEGKDIGDLSVLLDVCERIGLDQSGVLAAIDSEANQERLQDNWQQAQELGVFGVPTFIVDDQYFWGNDRIDFLRTHLTEMRLRKV